jgi:exodeoxyribonuclease V alpha subunit
MSSQLKIPPLHTATYHFETEDLKRSISNYEDMLRKAEDHAPFYHIEPYFVTLAAEIASFAVDLVEEEKAALTMICLTLLIDLNRGSTRTPADGDQAYLHFKKVYGQMLGKLSQPLLLFTRKLLDEKKAKHVITRDIEQYAPVIYHNDFLYMHKIFHTERHLSQLLMKRLDSPPLRDASSLNVILDDIRQRPALLKNGTEIRLNQEQEDALQKSLTQKLSFISGGPGTGKTSIVVALLRAFIRLGVDPNLIALAAPTGKAAWRMGESVNLGLKDMQNPSEDDEYLKNHPPIPQTIHRLLNYHPIEDRFKRHHQHPLDLEVFIVDESSMIDLFLMERLLNALPPHAQVIFLGDADQLPSVAAGAVFRDILKIAGNATATLTQSHRMKKDDPNGLAILSIAKEIKDGLGLYDIQGQKLSKWFEEKRLVNEIQMTGVWMLRQLVKEQYAFLDRWYYHFLAKNPMINQVWDYEDGKILSEQNEALGMIFDRFAKARILCLTQNLETGVQKVNARLHHRYARELQQEDHFLIGEPVMMLYNDYDRMLFNGDQGLVLVARSKNQPESRLMVAFPEIGGGFKVFDMESLIGRIEHCYAMTVHKSQGSEFDCVGIILPERSIPLLTKELIYTALTRAKKGVIFVGNPLLLSAQELISLDRNSALQDLIEDARKQAGK